MIRSNPTSRLGWMKAGAWVLTAGFLLAQPAVAHVPYLEDRDYSPEAPFEIPEPMEKSRAFYSWLETGEDIDVFAFQVNEPVRLFAQAIVPVCQGYEELLPWFAVVGPDLPLPDVPLPFDPPPGYGARVVENEEPWTPRETFFEPFGDKWYFDGPVFDGVLSTPGTWYLYYWNPYGIAGDYAAIVGAAEIWDPSDILRAIVYTPMIRAGEELHIECLGCPFLDERVLKDSDGDGVPDPCDEKRCFIATAAFGTELSGKIETLRSFRDRYLLNNGPGRAFVAFYNEHSPAIADVIRSEGWLRTAVRILLMPLIGLASLTV
jgi:hypothetical protein